MPITIILIILFFGLMLLLASGLWATAWPWVYFARYYYPPDDDDTPS